jgi:hypothetical protein
MKRKLLLSSAAISALMASGAMAQVVNFHDACNNDPLQSPLIAGGYYNELFAGQGAYADPGNNIWNGFGTYWFYFDTTTTDIYQSKTVYSGDGGPWPQQSGNPGNPYSIYFNYNNGVWIPATGSSLFNFDTASPTISGNATSDGQWTPITLSIITALGPDWDYGNAAGIPNGTPAFLLSADAYRYSGSPVAEIFTLQNVPAGTYGLYLYGAFYHNDCGTLFSLNSGSAHDGIAATLNSENGFPAQSFVEGQNFVIFENVTPDASGNITITASPNPLELVGTPTNYYEADVNGFQLIFNPPPTAVASTAAQNVLAGGTASFSFSPAFASSPAFRWQSIKGVVTNLLSDVGNISGSTTTNLTISNVGPGDVGLYQCVITTATATNTSPPAPLTLVTYTGWNILQPGDTLSDFGNNAPAGPPYYSIPPFFNMTVANVEDGTLNQYVNFGSNGDTAPFGGPVGFVVTPKAGSTVVTGLRLFTASSHPEDDPADYLLEGSTNGGSNYTAISSGALALPAQRNAAGGAINFSNQVCQEVDFANTVAYTTYRLTFTDVNSNAIASNGVQIAEVQLLAPAAIILQQPAAADVLLAGQTLNAGVVAGGAAPFTYQWYNVDTSEQIPDATNATLTVTNVQTSAHYNCVVGNAYGAATSTTLNLTVVTPTPYEAVVMADQPLAFYPLAETNGATAFDYVNGYNGTYLNGPTLGVPGPSSYLPVAAGFDGVSQSVLVPDTPALDFGGQITLEVWVQAGTQGSPCYNLSDIIAKGDDVIKNGSEIEMRIEAYEGATIFDAGYYNNTFGGFGAYGGVVTTNWTHVVFTFDGGYWNLYLNGVLVDSAAGTGGVGNFADPWGIASGTVDGACRVFAGNICAVAIYSHALTPLQVAAHYTMLPVLSIASGAAGSVVVSWPVSSATASFKLQQSGTLIGPWSDVTSQVVNGQNQATLTPGTSTAFFRLNQE